jgi:(5-formylfuran-3-yl)methyl phosphate synthase
MKLLVSVRTVSEAAIAAEGGADFIDLKEPRAGALGGLPVAVIADIVAALRAAGCSLPVSATIGDLPMHDITPIVAQARAVAACGVDYVKVGIERGDGAAAVLQALSALPFAVVPVFIADRGLDLDRIATALHFPAVMADTADKLSGNLFDCVPVAELQRFVALARAAGTMVGLAGALRHAHLPMLAALSPDFAGFRSAVCRGERGSALEATLLHGLADAVKGRRRPVPG